MFLFSINQNLCQHPIPLTAAEQKKASTKETTKPCGHIRHYDLETQFSLCSNELCPLHKNQKWGPPNFVIKPILLELALPISELHKSMWDALKQHRSFLSRCIVIKGWSYAEFASIFLSEKLVLSPCFYPVSRATSFSSNNLTVTVRKEICLHFRIFGSGPALGHRFVEHGHNTTFSG